MPAVSHENEELSEKDRAEAPWPFREPFSVSSLPYIMGVGAEQCVENGCLYYEVRVDEPLSDHNVSHCIAYCFDVHHAETKFGWSGVMTTKANAANMTLVNHIRFFNKNQIPTILIYDDNASRLPIFVDFVGLFDNARKR